MITIFLHRDGRVEQPTSIERNWLSPLHGAFLWVDIAAPSIPESLQHDHMVRLTFDGAALDGRVAALLTVVAGSAGRRWM